MSNVERRDDHQLVLKGGPGVSFGTSSCTNASSAVECFAALTKARHRGNDELSDSSRNESSHPAIQPAGRSIDRSYGHAAPAERSRKNAILESLVQLARRPGSTRPQVEREAGQQIAQEASEPGLSASLRITELRTAANNAQEEDLARSSSVMTDDGGPAPKE